MSERIEEIRERLEAARVPWKWSPPGRAFISQDDLGGVFGCDHRVPSQEIIEFLERAPYDLRHLLDRVERLEGAARNLVETVDENPASAAAHYAVDALREALDHTEQGQNDA